MTTLLNRMTGLAAGVLMATSVQAEAPMVKEQAPGYYRTMLGNFEITALSDGTVKLPVDELLLNTTREHVHQTLSDNFLSAPLETSVNAYLINTGQHLVLVDAGAGTLFGPTLGKLVDHLRASGYEPSDVDEILITHMHPDHVGGLVSDGGIVFPNATVRAHVDDRNYWLDEQNLKAADEGSKGFFKGAMASLNPYVEAGQLKPFEAGQQLMPGISAAPAAGHTPGHTLYKVESEGDTLMLWGDVVHVAAVQFPQPEVAIQFDVNSEQAIESRAEAFADAASTGFWIGAAHLSFPGLGHLKAAESGYEFVPANYQGHVGPADASE
ncbi:MAG: MBL fold metallo-hydrolase [Pseudomonadota bacterium]|nr:MBL fold metallo-hydrolase [Pseudomonadota bacterium]